MRGKLILTSQGLTTSIGRELIGEELEDEKLRDKKIYLFYEPYYSIADMLIKVCMEFGFAKDNIYLSDSGVSTEEIERMDYLYVTEGNTFEILELMQKRNVMEAMRKAVLNGATYIGASAGAMLAGQDTALAADFDKKPDFVNLKNLKGLTLFDGTIIAHYTAEELERYKANSEPSVIAGYKNIYSVANGEKLIL